MYVLLLVDSYLPNRSSAAIMIHELALELIRVGHDVTIITSTREMRGDIEVQETGMLRICRVNAGKGAGISRTGRAFAELALPLLVWWRARSEITRRRPDMIVFYSPTIFWGWLVKRIKALHGCPAYLIVRDIFPQWAVDVGLIRNNGPVFRFFHIIEKFQYRVADRIGVESPSSLNYFTRFPALETKTEVLWNWVADSAPPPSRSTVRERFGLVGKTVFFYGGNMGVAQRMDRLLRLAEAFHENRAVHFVLVGEGSERARLRADAIRMGLDNLLILEPVSQAEFISMLAEFDIGVVLLDPQLSTHNVPGKLLSYAAAGKPTIAEVNAGNDLIGLLHTYRAGLASANDQAAFILNAKLLAGDSDLRAELGENSRTLARELFSVQTAARQITALGFLEEP